MPRPGWNEHYWKHMDKATERRLRTACPRCGSDKVERVKYLFGSESAEGLTPQDYFDAYLRP